MESDGRIRSKDIGTNEVNSRTLDNIRSSNFDGSHTSPETDPGTQGWQILKSGFVVFNNAIIRGTLKAVKILSGTLNIGAGGSITVGNEADPLVTLDESGLSVGDAPVVIDNTGLDIGNGLTVIDSSGVQVGTDVVMDSTGLQVIGGYVTPLWIGRDTDGTQNFSLTTTNQTVMTTVITPPAWVQNLFVMISTYAQITETTTKNLIVVHNSGGSDFSSFEFTVAAGTTNNFNQVPTASATGGTYTLNTKARVSSGTNSSNFFTSNVIAWGTR